MLRELKKAARDLKRDLPVYQQALKDPRTPKLAKALLALAVAYAVLPFDLIPDFIPIVGHMDDAIIIPILIRLALKMIPEEVLDDCRLRVEATVKVKTRPITKLRRKTHRV